MMNPNPQSFHLGFPQIAPNPGFASRFPVPDVSSPMFILSQMLGGGVLMISHHPDCFISFIANEK